MKLIAILAVFVAFFVQALFVLIWCFEATEVGGYVPFFLVMSCLPVAFAAGWMIAQPRKNAQVTRDLPVINFHN